MVRLGPDAALAARITADVERAVASHDCGWEGAASTSPPRQLAQRQGLGGAPEAAAERGGRAWLNAGGERAGKRPQAVANPEKAPSHARAGGGHGPKGRRQFHEPEALGTPSKGTLDLRIGAIQRCLRTLRRTALCARAAAEPRLQGWDEIASVLGAGHSAGPAPQGTSLRLHKAIFYDGSATPRKTVCPCNSASSCPIRAGNRELGVT